MSQKHTEEQFEEVISKYTIRVFIIDSEPADYLVLHEALKSEGFVEHLIGENKSKYQLPDGEYSIIAKLNITEVMQKAKNAIQKTNKSSRILISKCSTRLFKNLEIIPPQT